MAIWFRKNKVHKWHMACYGGSIAECGRDVKIAAVHAPERMQLEVDDGSKQRKDLCQACVNSILRGREYIKQLDERERERKQRSEAER